MIAVFAPVSLLISLTGGTHSDVVVPFETVSHPAPSLASHRASHQSSYNTAYQRAFDSVIIWARLAIEGDSVEVVEQQWQSQVAGDSFSFTAALGLATLSRLSYNYQRAEERYQEMLVRLNLRANGRDGSSLQSDPGQPGPGQPGYEIPAAMCYVYLGLGWQADTRGDLIAADSFFQAARVYGRRARNPSLEAEAMLGLAMARGPVDGVFAAIALVDSVRVLLPSNENHLHADYWLRKAVLSAVISDTVAVQQAQSARRISRALDDTRREAKAIGVTALFYRLQGNDQRAIALYDSAAVLQAQSRDYSSLAETLLRQGDAYRSRSQIYAFKQNMLRASRYAEASRNEIAARSVLVQLGNISLLVKDYASANAYLNQAVSKATQTNAPDELAIARTMLAHLYLAMDRYAQSRTELLEALKYYRHVNDGAYELAVLRDLIAVELRSSNIPAAENYLGQAEALASKRQQRIWSRWLNEERGMIALAKGNFTVANRYFTDIADIYDDEQQVAIHAVRLRIAETLALMGNYAGAYEELSRAELALNEWRASLDDGELRRLAFQVTPREQSATDQSIATLVNLLSNGGYTSQVAEFAERRRTRELNSKLRRAKALSSLDAAVSEAPYSETPIADFAETPDPALAVVSFVTGSVGSPSTMFITTVDSSHNHHIESFSLPSADSIVGDIARLMTLIESGENPSFLLRKLGSLILDPVLNDQHANGQHAKRQSSSVITRLIIIPDGPLHRIPYDALLMADGKYAVERFTISITPSLGVIAHSREQTEGKPGSIVSFGDPLINAQTLTELNELQLSTQVRTLLPIPGSRKEAREVASLGKSLLRLGKEATATALFSSLKGDNSVIHLATHAIVDDRSPAKTALLLSPDSVGGGALFPGDISSLNIAADLAFLSACETLGGVNVDGEGVQGLTSSFLEAGVRTVIASHWPVRDETNGPLVQSFYSSALEGATMAEAMRTAKLEALEAGAPLSHWANFSVVGDPDVQISVVPQSFLARFRWQLFTLLLFVLTVSLVVTMWARKR